MANKSSDNAIIKLMLEENKINSGNLLNFTHINSEKNIPLGEVVILLDNCDEFNKKMNNKKSKHYTNNDKNRRDSLMQMCYTWLVCHNYDEYYMIDAKLPISVECFINNETNIHMEIDDLLCERITQQAEECDKTYPEVIEILKQKFYIK